MGRYVELVTDGVGKYVDEVTDDVGMDDDMLDSVPTDVGTDDAIAPAVPTDNTTSLPDGVGDDVNAPPTPPVAIGGFVTSKVERYVCVDVDPATMPPPSLANIVGIAVIPPTPPVATDGVGATLSYARYVGILLSAAVGAGTTLGISLLLLLLLLHRCCH